MKLLYSISTMLLLLSLRSYGQAVPTATATPTPNPAAEAGPRLSWVDGTVHYALNASELVQFGYYGSGRITSTTALSGNVGYASLSETHPSSLLFAGGVLFGQGGQGVRTYQNAAVSQSLIKGKWILGVTDSFTFLPQSPTTGLSGIAGVGPIGTIPLDGPSAGPAGGVLTYSGNRIGNTLGGNVERLLTGKTSISGGVSWMVLHFLDSNAGLDSGSVSGQVALNHSINLRNSMSVSGVYSRYKTTGLYANVPGSPSDQLVYYTKGVNLTYTRQWTRLLGTNVSVGPQWLSSSSPQLIPDRLNVYVNASLSYTRQVGNFALRYTRGVNGGSGAFAGAQADNVSGMFSRSIARNWSASAMVSYVHTSGLVRTISNLGVNRTIITEYGTVQLMHGFSRTISAHLSYSAQNQDGNTPQAAQNVVRGLSHTIGFGVSWTPQSTRFGDF